MSQDSKSSKAGAGAVAEPSNFLRQIIDHDLASGAFAKRTNLAGEPTPSVITRFPPEPNGYLHIGHAKSICLNFGLSAHFGGGTNLRFDDTNPATEETEYVESIKADLQWLGFRWVKECYASDYFDTLYGYAVQLIEKGNRYTIGSFWDFADCEYSEEDLEKWKIELKEIRDQQEIQYKEWNSLKDSGYRPNPKEDSAPIEIKKGL